MLTKEQINFLDKYVTGTWEFKPREGLVDVDGSFKLEGGNWKTLQGIRFGSITGNFECSRNKLTSLEGAPQQVLGDFGCCRNKLTSLKGAPQNVGGGFYCYKNKLTSLKGAPQNVGGDFYCHKNKLTSLKGAPRKVGGDFECSDNKLTSLKGAPTKVRGNFDCSRNKLTSLEGIPLKAGRGFSSDIFDNYSNIKFTEETLMKVYLNKASSVNMVNLKKTRSLIKPLLKKETLDKYIFIDF